MPSSTRPPTPSSGSSRADRRRSPGRRPRTDEGTGRVPAHPRRGAGDQEVARPTPGELLALLPAWPREWAQRLGRVAFDLGARLEVWRRPDAAGGWALTWVRERRRLLALLPLPEAVWVEVALGEREAHRAMEDIRTDEEFRERLRSATARRGIRTLRVRVDTPRRVATLEAVLLSKVRGA